MSCDKESLRILIGLENTHNHATSCLKTFVGNHCFFNFTTTKIQITCVNRVEYMKSTKCIFINVYFYFDIDVSSIDFKLHFIRKAGPLEAFFIFFPNSIQNYNP